jgi:hypothetical protein
MIHSASRDRLFRYYRIENANHIDALVDTYPPQLRPIAPCFQSATDAMATWLDGHNPTPSTTVSSNRDCTFT